MTDENKFYDRVGSKIGWDFSSMKFTIEGEKWNFIELVKKYLNKDTVLLDLGTGSGEKLLQLSDFVKKAIGIDKSVSMTKIANKNLKKSGKSNVEFKVAGVEQLPLPSEHFDIVTCRHAPFVAKEVFRVLMSNGLFITQQVGEGDKQNIKEIFGRGQCFRQKPGTLMKKYLKELINAGFKILKTDEYNATDYYASMNDLMFLLKNTPIILDFDVKRDMPYLRELNQKYKTEKGIKTNSSRFLIIARKQK